MVVELPYSAGPESVRILTADSVIEIAVSIINNSTEILPDTLVKIVRVNIRADYDNPESVGEKSNGFAILQAHTYLTNTTLQSTSPIVLAQGNPQDPTHSSARMYSYYNTPCKIMHVSLIYN
jgi:hypothetical protein